MAQIHSCIVQRQSGRESSCQNRGPAIDESRVALNIERNEFAKIGSFNALATEVVRCVKWDAPDKITEMNLRILRWLGLCVQHSQWQYYSRQRAFDGIITGGDKGAPVMKTAKITTHPLNIVNASIAYTAFILKSLGFLYLGHRSARCGTSTCEMTIARRKS